MNKPHFDIVIVGGGILGLYTAVAAQKKWPHASVALFDKLSVGEGASHYAPGIQLAYSRNDKEKELAQIGMKRWRKHFNNWKWRSGRDLPIQWVSQQPDKIEKLALEVLSPCQPFTGGSLGSLIVNDQLQMRQGLCSYDPVNQIVIKLKNEFEELGGILFHGVEIQSIVHYKSDFLLLQDQKGRHYISRQCVVSLGPWITQSPLKFLCSTTQNIKVKKVAALELNIAPNYEEPAMGFADDYAFLLPMYHEKKWLFSFSSDHWDVDPNHKLQLDSNDRDKAICILSKYFHLIPHDISSRVFCDAYLPNGIPQVEFADDNEKIVFVLAGAGNGFRFAPPISETAIEYLERHYINT